MTKTLNPSEIARETLRQLAMRRKLPTPDNYRELYHEIAETPVSENFPTQSLKGLVGALPRKTNDQAKLARRMDAALAKESWRELTETLREFVESATAEPPSWGALIKTLISEMQKRHSGLTAARKREALDLVLASSTTPDALFTRLQSVVRGWSQQGVGSEVVEEESAEITGSPTSRAVTSTGLEHGAAIALLQELLASLLENAIAMILNEQPELLTEAKHLATVARSAKTPEQVTSLAEHIKRFSYKLHFVAEDQIEMKAALLHLVQLIIDNVNELVVDDKWLAGQITIVRDLMAEPMSLRRLDDVERRMKDVIFKQSSLKHSLNDAKERLKEMLATFVDRLADFSESTSGYHDKIERCAERISQANDIAELSDVLDEVMRETRVVQLNAQRSRDELHTMQTRVDHAEKEVLRLQEELAQASDMVRTDPLTGALNRKGMNESIEREAARAKRQSGPLCMALLDIDNFKKLNDGLGHDAGDAALIHLTKVVQETIRPHDTLARYGGEEFVVLLPSTSIDDAVQVMVRVQRELTRKFFLHNNDKVLITFSCGVAEMTVEEDPFDTLKRADAGMYMAKRSGKNRVVPT